MDYELSDFKKEARWTRLLEKRLVKKPEEVKTLHRRTLQSAKAIIRCLRGLDFSDFSRSLFFLCADSKMDAFTREYEAQLELALIDEDKFVKNLHKFYLATAIRIERDGLYENFFQFMSFFCMKRYVYKNTSIQRSVSDSYVNLLLQQTEYLRKNKLDLSKRVIGVSTKGDVLLADDYMPNLDAAINQLEYECTVEGRPRGGDMERRLAELLHRAGLPAMISPDAYEEIAQTDRLFTNTLCVMSPYINEYTCDMLPTAGKPLSANIYALSLLETDIDEDLLKDELTRRARTLPSNGVTFLFEPESSQIIPRVTMKEILFGDEILMLYQVTTCIGETSGFYNTQSKQFFSVLEDADPSSIFQRFKCSVLYLYACAVLRNGNKLLHEVHNSIRFRDRGDVNEFLDYDVKMILSGGKVRDVYQTSRENTPDLDDKWHYESRQIQGFIRRLPEGQHASSEAKERAKLLGFALNENETYVQGFIKNVPCLQEN